jgi:hypothetical protein
LRLTKRRGRITKKKIRMMRMTIMMPAARRVRRVRRAKAKRTCPRRKKPFW